MLRGGPYRGIAWGNTKAVSQQRPRRPSTATQLIKSSFKALRASEAHVCRGL